MGDPGETHTGGAGDSDPGDAVPPDIKTSKNAADTLLRLPRGSMSAALAFLGLADAESNLIRAWRTLAGLAVVGWSVVVVFAVLNRSIPSSTGGAAVDGVIVAAVLIALTLGALGLAGLIGFLFGLPKSGGPSKSRSVRQETRAGGTEQNVIPGDTQGNLIPEGESGLRSEPVTSEVTTSSEIDDAQSGKYVGNTNLEKVSDWLTTVIVGVTLVQLGSIITGIAEFAKYLDSSLGVSFAGAMGVALILAYSAIGFMGGFMWTTTRFRWSLEQMEISERQLLQELAKSRR